MNIHHVHHLEPRPGHGGAPTGSTRRRTATRLAGLGVAVLLGVTACSSGGSNASTGSTSASNTPTSAAASGATAKSASVSGTNYVGKIDGTASLLAVQIDGTKANAYYCDSQKEWGALDGTVSGNTVTAKDPGGDTLTGTLNGDQLTGTITISGTPHTFTAEKATGQAGVYSLETKTADGTTETAWVRDNQGNVAGGSFAVNTKKLGDLSSVIAGTKKFTPEQLQTINQIVNSGVVPSVPPSGGVADGAQPFKLGGAIRCGIAGFKFKRAQSALNAPGGETNENIDTFFDSVRNVNSACGMNLPT